jgi:hypothetical protein
MENYRNWMANRHFQEQAFAPRCPGPTEEKTRQKLRLVVEAVQYELIYLGGKPVRYGFRERQRCNRWLVVPSTDIEGEW